MAQHAPQTGNTGVRAAFPGVRTAILVGDHALSDRLLGNFSAKPAGKYVEGRDSILCETTVETANLAARVHDIFVIGDGKATHHFTYTIETTSKLAVLSPTKAS
jgi:hypothetical protein